MKTNDLKICGIPLDIAWKDKHRNFEMIDRLSQGIDADLILLPEMFSTGFYMNAEEIADRHEETLTWMKHFAQSKKVAVGGSASVAEHGKYYNRFYFVQPSGEYQQYDKRHLFSYSGEDKTYSAGEKRVIVEYKGWKILLQVCYDLRFPVFARNNSDYDAILYVANWPEARIDAWKTLLKARAIENQSYVFGLNRTGTDGNNLHYPESSYCYFPDGEIISEDKNSLVEAVFDKQKLDEFRTKFRFLDDRDDFKLL